MITWSSSAYVTSRVSAVAIGPGHRVAGDAEDLGVDFCDAVSDRNPLVADPLRRTDCSLVSDGAAAVVIAAPDVARTAARAEAGVELADLDLRSGEPRRTGGGDVRRLAGGCRVRARQLPAHPGRADGTGGADAAVGLGVPCGLRRARRRRLGRRGPARRNVVDRSRRPGIRHRGGSSGLRLTPARRRRPAGSPRCSGESTSSTTTSG